MNGHRWVIFDRQLKLAGHRNIQYLSNYQVSYILVIHVVVTRLLIDDSYTEPWALTLIVGWLEEPYCSRRELERRVLIHSDQGI